MITPLVLIPLLGAALSLLGFHARRLAAAAAVGSIGTALVAALLHGPALLHDPARVGPPADGAVRLGTPGVGAVGAGAQGAGAAIRETIGGWTFPFGIELVLDGAAWFGVVTVLSVALLIYLYSLGEDDYSATFTFFYLIAVAGMVGLIVSADLFNIFVCFEILSLAAYLLIAYKRRPRAIYAGFRYLVIGTIGMSLYLLGVLVAYRETGMLSIAAIGQALAGSAPTPAVTVAVAALIAGIGTRVAFFPFHIWLPEAHSQAPHPVSALLSGVMIKAGFLTLYRIMSAFPPVPVAAVFEIVGPVTALVGVFLALMQSDMKRLLAFHSVSQMGYILTGFAFAAGAGGYAALAGTGAILHMINHAVFKSLLFLSIGVVISTTGERDLYRVRGMRRMLPFTAVVYAVAAGAICGIPPLNGFASKTLISAGVKLSPWYPLLQLASVGTVASFIKLSRVFLGQPDAQPGVAMRGSSAVQRVAMGVFAALCVGLGLLPVWWARTVAGAIGGPARFPAVAFFAPPELLSAALTVAGGAMVYSVLSRPLAAGVVRTIRNAQLGIEQSVVSVLYGVCGIALALTLLLLHNA